MCFSDGVPCALNLDPRLQPVPRSPAVRPRPSPLGLCRSAMNISTLVILFMGTVCLGAFLLICCVICLMIHLCREAPVPAPPVSVRQRIAKRSAAEILRAYTPSMTAVDRASTGVPCAICLGELCENAERGERDLDRGPEGRKDGLDAVVIDLVSGTRHATPRSGDESPDSPATSTGRCDGMKGEQPTANPEAESTRVGLPFCGAAPPPPPPPLRNSRGDGSATPGQDAPPRPGRTPPRPGRIATVSLPPLPRLHVSAAERENAAAIAAGPRLVSLPCGHVYHGVCIRAWIVHRHQRASCPLCKCELLAREGIPAGEGGAAWEGEEGGVAVDGGHLQVQAVQV